MADVLPMMQTYTVKAGDTLSKIAELVYRDFRQWNYIASVNSLSNAGNLKVGQVLKIPPLTAYASTQPAIASNFAASPRAGTDTLIEELQSTAVRLPSVNTNIDSTNAPAPGSINYTANPYDLGTVEVAAGKVAPWWFVGVLLVAGYFILKD